MLILKKDATKLLVLTCLAVWFSKCASQILGVYHQDDYDVKLERAEVKFCNKSMARNCRFGFVLYNRTQRVINVSWNQIVDFTNDFTGSVQLYKFMSNEYRFFPLTLNSNICFEYNRDTFGVKSLLVNHSNFHGCPLKKGYYYIGNFLPDFSKLPPYIPKGSYQIEIKIYHQSDYLSHMNGYAVILDKPIKWNK